ncbi:MAG: hypothetical protein Q9186_000551 [Xanthomendoza sp. 1 TL-2023]
MPAVSARRKLTGEGAAAAHLTRLPSEIDQFHEQEKERAQAIHQVPRAAELSGMHVWHTNKRV